jgi:hypothetical protein
MSDSKPPTPGERADQRRQKAIGQVLARQYNPVTEEPAPDEMLELLKAADRLRAAKRPQGGS